MSVINKLATCSSISPIFVAGVTAMSCVSLESNSPAVVLGIKFFTSSRWPVNNIVSVSYHINTT